MVLRLRVSLKPHETKSFALLAIAGESEIVVKKVAARYSPASLDWVYRDAARVTAREITHLRIAPEFLPVMQALSAVLVQPHPALRRVPARVGDNLLGQANLWRFGLSGDIPILLLRLTHVSSMGLLEELIRAQCYWRRTGLKIDIAVLRTDSAGYEDPLREKIQDILRDTSFADSLGRSGGIHLLAGADMSPEVRRGVEAAAHVVIDDDDISLREKLDKILEQRSALPLMVATGDAWQEPPAQTMKPPALLFDNGVGGFDATTGDYVIHLAAGQQTPAPWCNVLASEQFGSIVSDSHLGFTWAVNSGENRLTPLSNDPQADTPGEVLYLRDEITAEVWPPTPAPLGNSAACTVTHGKGSTRWQRQCHGLAQTMDVWVSVDDPIKLLRLRLTNQLPQQRRLTATFYAEWLLGALGSRVRPHVVCEYDASLHAILAGNPWNADFAERIGFVSASKAPHSVTGDRFEFLGSEGDVRRPAGLRHKSLGGHFAPGGDACAGYQVHIDLAPGEDAEVVFMLGQGANRSETRRLVMRYQDPIQVEQSFVAVRQFWAARLQRLQVTTPEPAFDMMINHWLLYQSLASRVLARAGFYQASGAFGFRDQLQDGLALLAVDPARVRSLILAAAAHQFDTGDVQHWWHPPSDRGVKTRCSDDYLWLVFVTARYVDATGDTAVLDVEIAYLLAPPLRDDEHDRYARFDNGRPASLFDHCLRALDRMLATGRHGLPLMGTGDWNDGMDRVGAQGRGESVWLAWFQIAVVNAFMPLASARGHSFRRWQAHASRLKSAIDACAWDGSWFLRAFDDDGEPWGSQQNEACQIDSISQSWGVLAGFADDARVQQAMASARQHLLVEGAGLVPLLTPPFQTSTRDPGYIQAYPPGVRENGGQYNHAVAWLGLACCGLGEGDAALQLFDRMHPISRTNTPGGAAHYGREPYVLAGDIATEGRQRGQGGWSWYTGSASWAWQLGIEGLLGLRLRADGLQIRPCLPKDWETVSVRFERDAHGTLLLRINNPDRVGQGLVDLRCDGQAVTGDLVKFPGPGLTSRIEVNIRADARHDASQS
jgi:cyclic beta-1,2-glucan synthetase